VSKRASLAHFGPARQWPAKNGSGWVGLPSINGPKTITRPVFGRAGPSLLFINLLYIYIYIYIYIYLYNRKKVLFFIFFFNNKKIKKKKKTSCRAGLFWPVKLASQTGRVAAGWRVGNSNPTRPFLGGLAGRPGGPDPFCHPY